MAFLQEFLASAVVDRDLHPIGPDENPEGRLLGSIYVGPISFHVECVEVERVGSGEGLGEEQVAVIGEEYHSYYDLADALGGTEPFEEVTINGRQYVMFIYPYCE